MTEEQLALQIDPDNLSNYFKNLSECHIALNQLDQAETVLREAEACKLERDYVLQERYLLAFRRVERREAN